MSERIRCKYCNSNNIVKWQSPNRFKCKNCGRTFLINTAINDEIITKISEGVTKLEVNLKTNEDRIRLVPRRYTCWGTKRAM